MATKTIVSGENKTPVGKPGTKLYTRTRTTYTLNENGEIDPKSVKQEILYSQIPGDPPVVAATRNGTIGDFTFNKNEFTGEFYFGADAQKSLKQGALKTTTQQQIQTSAKKEGLTPEQQKVLSNNTNTASIDPSTDQQQGINSDQSKFIEKQGKDLKARKNYGDVIYPIGLDTKYQDCIKFSVVEYKASGLKGFGESEAGSRIVDIVNNNPSLSQGKERKIIGTITLPIPGGIQDSNTVNWSGSDLSDPFAALGAIGQAELQSGQGATEAQKQIKGALADSPGVRQAIISGVIGKIIGNNNIMQRAYGTRINPNIELLFNNPDLRTFSFSFKLSPRSSVEAKNVKQIIRTFKQAMSVQRSKSSFLLATPNTFAISYIFKDGPHPYLNKFKECALTSCNVNYTPEGNYMSFNDENDPSMVSYQLDLTFQELEPIYNDDYGQDKYDNIGF